MAFFNQTNGTILQIPEGEEDCDPIIFRWIMRIQPIFLLIFGFVANLCSFAVLIQPRLRRRPTFSYLAFLSLSNAFLSLIHAFFTIMAVYFDKSVEALPLFLFCRLLNRFAIDFLTHFSLCTLTAVDVDRVTTVTSKTNAQRRYSRGAGAHYHGCSKGFQRVCLIELSFAILLFFVNLHWLTSYGRPSSQFNERTMCTLADLDEYSLIYVRYLRLILPYVELILFGILPFLISLIATIIILRHVSVKYAFVNSHNQHLKQSRRRIELHLSILLISLNCVYILFTTPHNIYTIHLLQLHRQLDHKTHSEGDVCQVAVTQKSLDLLQQCYFMSTFFLYILTNKRFREEFYRVFQCLRFNLCPKRSEIDPSTAIATNVHHQKKSYNIHLTENYLVAPLRDISGSRTSISDASQDDEPVSTIND